MAEVLRCGRERSWAFHPLRVIAGLEPAIHDELQQDRNLRSDFF
jgi:hypothetical protein